MAQVHGRLLADRGPGVIAGLARDRDAAMEAYIEGDLEKDAFYRLLATIDGHLADPDPYIAGQLANILRRGTVEPWAKIRKRIYERDRGICHVCGRDVEPEFYECGHIVDRCKGGSDLDWNLACMCLTCNRTIKDVHATRAEYLDWLATEPASLRTLRTQAQAVARRL